MFEKPKGFEARGQIKAEGGKNDPEKNENKIDKELSGKELSDIIRKKTEEKTEELYGVEKAKLSEKERESFDRYVDYVAWTDQAGYVSSEYFRGLIPRSLRKPIKEYKDHESSSIISRDELMAGFKNEMKIDGDMSRDFKSDVYEHHVEDGIQQMMYNRFMREDGEWVVEEWIANFLKEDTSEAESWLALVNIKSGVRVDLNQLLPNKYDFVPSELENLERIVERGKKKGDKPMIYEKRRRVDLKSYNEDKGGDARRKFFDNKTWKKVGYGDLKNKGSVLTLFHEIAHTWQDTYYDRHHEGEYRELIREAAVWCNILKEKLEEFASGMTNKEDLEFYFDFTEKQLKKSGIEIDRNNFIYKEGQELEEGQMLLFDFVDEKDPNSDIQKMYIVRSRQIEDSLREYESTERDAWAHALLMLRFFRKGGVDLEPQMKNKDLFGFIEPNLDSYQNSIGSGPFGVEIVGRETKFIKEGNRVKKKFS